jgi:SAM-dependent methyltransferase
MAELEGKGLDFERYAMNKLFHAMVKRHQFKSVLEMPAKGEKAMPSIYSVALAQAGCDVSLVNAEPKSDWAWKELEYPVTHLQTDDLANTGFEDSNWDLVWNFMALAKAPDPAAMVQEMKRLSRGYVMFISVNRFNPGFFSHRACHKYFDVPWNHGAVEFMNVFHVRRFFKEQGLQIVDNGVVDCPPYPDSLGFRDMRLHRMNVDLDKIDWDSNSIHWMKAGVYPPKIKWLYLAEQLPLPWQVKLLYAHLFWVLAKVA